MTTAAPTTDVRPPSAPSAPPTAPSTVLGRWAGNCYDHRRTVLLAWILLLVGVTAVAQLVGS